MMRRLNHHRAEMKKKILEEQMIDNHKPAKPQNMVYQKFSIFDQIFLISRLFPVETETVVIGSFDKSVTESLKMFLVHANQFPLLVPSKKGIGSNFKFKT